LHERGKGRLREFGDVTGFGFRASEFEVESPSGERGADSAFFEEAAAAGISGFGFRGHRVWVWFGCVDGRFALSKVRSKERQM
jgi:hypothetical protein